MIAQHLMLLASCEIDRMDMHVHCGHNVSTCTQALHSHPGTLMICVQVMDKKTNDRILKALAESIFFVKPAQVTLGGGLGQSSLLNHKVTDTKLSNSCHIATSLQYTFPMQKTTRQRGASTL